MKTGELDISRLIDAIGGADVIGFIFGITNIAVALITIILWNSFSFTDTNGLSRSHELEGLSFIHVLVLYIAIAMLGGVVTSFVLHRHIRRPDDAIILGSIPGLAISLTLFVPIYLVLTTFYSDISFTFWTYILSLVFGILIFVPATTISAYLYTRMTTGYPKHNKTGQATEIAFHHHAWLNRRTYGLAFAVAAVVLIFVIPLAFAYIGMSSGWL